MRIENISVRKSVEMRVRFSLGPAGACDYVRNTLLCNVMQFLILSDLSPRLAPDALCGEFDDQVKSMSKVSKLSTCTQICSPLYTFTFENFAVKCLKMCLFWPHKLVVGYHRAFTRSNIKRNTKNMIFFMLMNKFFY